MFWVNDHVASSGDAKMTYLKRRVSEEAQAAVSSPSTTATLVHVMLATAYAKRVGEQTRLNSRERWVDQHRVW